MMLLVFYFWVVVLLLLYFPLLQITRWDLGCYLLHLTFFFLLKEMINFLSVYLLIY